MAVPSLSRSEHNYVTSSQRAPRSAATSARKSWLSVTSRLREAIVFLDASGASCGRMFFVSSPEMAVAWSESIPLSILSTIVANEEPSCYFE